MICKKWLGLSGRAASVVVVCLIAGALVVPQLRAQSAQTSVGSTVVKPTAPPAFLVAPSLSLSYSPTSVASGHLSAGAGLDLVTADYNSGSITVFRALGPGSFAPGVSYPSGAHPTSLTIADIDGDGRADVLLANESENTITILNGNGDGTLSPRKTYNVGFAPSFLAVGDFSGSGKPDVVVAGTSGKTLALLQNDGAGGLKRPLNFALTATPTALLSADLNHDGHLDVAVATAAGTVSVLIGKGNGQFTALPDIQVATGSLSSIAAGDFNRDGIEDLVVTAGAESKVAVLLGQGDGKFSSPSFFDVGNSPVSTQVADVDGDGIADLIVVNKGSNTFSVLAGVGDGTFKGALHFVVGNSPLGAAIGDLYGTGHVDIATIDALSRTLTVPIGNGDGTFAAGRAYSAGVQPVSVASGDLDGDGKPDLVAANYCATDASCGGEGSTAVLLSGPAGTYRLSSTYVMGTGSVSIALRDVNGDKKLDLVALNRVDRSVSIRLGAGDGTFGPLTTFPLSIAPIAVEAADFNKDGNLDLAVLGDCGSAACSQPGELAILFGSGDGSFRSGTTYPVGYSPVSLAVGATRSAGTPDILVANRCGTDVACKAAGNATILFGDGKGGFTQGNDLALGNGPSSIALADLRGQGTLDLIVSRSGDNSVAVLPGAGDGSFKPPVPYAVGTTPGALTVADFNGDGVPDVAVANTADSTVSVLFGRNDGTLQKSFALPVGGNPASLTAIPSPTTGHASLATANGSPAASSATPSGITVVANLINPTPQATGTATSATTWNSPPSTATVNASVTLNVTVAFSGTGTAPTTAPSGSVLITSNGTPSSVCTIGLATGVSGTTNSGSCTVSNLDTSMTTLSAQYQGDSNYAAQTNTTDTSITVSALNPTLSFTPAPTPASPAALNQDVLFTVQLGGPGITFLPTAPNGNVTFLLNNAPALCGGLPNNNVVPINPNSGAAVCGISNMQAGSPQNVTATYSGDTNFVVTAGAAAAPSYTINPEIGTLGLIASTTANPNVTSVTVGTNVTLTVNYTGITTSSIAPNGTVTFTVNGVANNPCPSQPLNTTTNPVLQATCTLSNLKTGSYGIVASFGGDKNFTPSPVSMALAVTQATPTMTLVSDTPTAVVNQPITFTATVANPGTGTVFPTGNVTFTQGTTTLCSSVGLNTAVTPPAATCKYNFTAPVASGSVVTAAYSGDADFTATSKTTAQTVGAATTTIKVTSPPSGTTIGLNQALTINTAITPQFAGTTVPQGTVKFTTTATTAPTGTCAGGVPVNPDGTVPACTLIFSTSGAVQITAQFTTGDANFSSSPVSAVDSVTVNPGAFGINLQSTPNPSSVDQQVTFSAAFTSTLSPVPTKSVTYTDVTVPASPVTLCVATVAANGTIGTCTHTFTSAATYSVQASYPGDSSYSAATSNSVAQIVQKTQVGTAVTAASGNASVNETVQFTATLSPAFTSTGGAQPTGTVTFYQTVNGAKSALSCPVVTLPASPITCSAAFAAVANYSITAEYSGDGNFVQGTNSPFGLSVGTAQTTVGVTATVNVTPATVFVNRSGAVTFTATVTPTTTGAAVPTGTITFSDSIANGSVLCSPQSLKANGSGGATASCTATFLLYGGGSHTINAAYSGDGNFPANSKSIAQSVSPTTTKTQLTSSGSAAVNQSVTFSTTLTPAYPLPVGGVVNYTGFTIPTGTITYAVTPPTGVTGTATGTCLSGVTTIASDGTVPNCNLTFPHFGTWVVTATYQPDPNFVTSSGPANQSVTSAAVTVVVNSGQQGTSIVNQPMTFTAAFTPQPIGTQPVGTVSFSTNGTPASSGSTCTSSLQVTSGTIPQCTYTFATAGTFTVSATYNPASGNQDFAGTTSAAVTQIVSQATAALNLNQPAASVVNQSVTFAASFTLPPSGTLPQGNVSYVDTIIPTSPVILCNQPIAADGSVPACAYAFTTVGSHMIQARFTPSANAANFTATNSAIITQTVSQAPVTVVVTSPNPASSVNESVTFTAKITPSPATLANPLNPPTGTATFYNGGTSIGACTNVPMNKNGDGSESATCPFTFTASGPYTISASYNGDTNFKALPQQSSTAATQTVGAPTTTITVAPAVTAPSVNQTFNFNVQITPPPASAGSTTPTGTISFSDTDSRTLLCPLVQVSPGASGIGTANCQITFLNAGSHTIKATYSSADSNFTAGSPGTATLVVSPENSQLSLNSSPSPSFPGQPVTYTATVTPTPFFGLNNLKQSLQVPAGSVTFTLTDSNGMATTPCSAVKVSPTIPSDGTSSASCLVTFSHSPAPSGQFSMNAVFSADPNFQSSNNTIGQIVQDFNITSSLTPGNNSISSNAGVYLTQGNTTGNDPFGAANLAVLITTSPGYINPKLNVTCEVYSTDSGSPLADPACDPLTVPPVSISSNPAMQQFAVAATPSAPVGQYTVRFTVFDPLDPNGKPNLQSTNAQYIEFPLYVVKPSAQLTLGAGATATQNVPFNTVGAPATMSLKFSCLNIWDTVAMKMLDNPQAKISCTSDATEPISTMGAMTPIPIKINSNPSASAQNQQLPNTMYLAGMLGVPVFAIVGWLVTRKSSRRSLIRFFGLMILLMGLSYMNGCGGSYRVSQLTPSGGIPVGSYQVQVVATDTTGKNYYAVVPLNVVQVSTTP